MPIDIFNSRRKCYEECYWWSRDPNIDFDEDELIYKRQPTGMFYAYEFVPETLDNNIAGGAFLFDRTSVTLKTYDECSGIKNADLVRYQGDRWIVESVQKMHIRNQANEFAEERYVSHCWIIQLRK